ncbi:Dual-specificity RNA pseudouridine synthase RluA [Anaerolineales bacterium]|nr:Dual-specificity RNA pseudouridine synthase RluA [Anaerolineales bacterium]
MNILYKDEHLLVVNKPAGLSILPEGWEPDAPYLVKMLEETYSRIWVIHRIDKITSGVVIFALTADAHRSLNIQFEKHQVDKKYHAIVNGLPKWDEKATKFPLRVNVGHKHRTMVDNKSGVKSETHFKVLKRGRELSLLEAVPMTGRTHQIRVHAYALGFPLLGDNLYSAPGTDLIARPALHAYSLTVNHPVTNERLTFTAPYPEDFQAALFTLSA